MIIAHNETIIGALINMSGIEIDVKNLSTVEKTMYRRFLLREQLINEGA